jgi:hypothetical protein
MDAPSQQPLNHGSNEGNLSPGKMKLDCSTDVERDMNGKSERFAAGNMV